MIRPLLPGEHTYDICVVGAGPAGLTFAAELAYTGHRMCVLESGLLTKSAFATKLKEAQGSMLPIKAQSRERIVGGASTVWGGLSAILDSGDLKSWPIDSAELEPYLNRATCFHFPTPQEFSPSRYPNLVGWKGLRNLADKIFIAVRPAFNFASLIHIFGREGIDLYTDATVTGIYKNGTSVEKLVCRNSHGEMMEVRAKFFVLAAGGIENPRLLLNSDIGNEHDQVGRHFMNHPKGYAGKLRLHKPLPPHTYYLPRDMRGRMIYAGLTLSSALQKEKRLGNPCVQFEPDLGLFQRYAFALWRRLPQFTSHMLAFMRPRTLRARWFADMEPRSENRVGLGVEQDVFGQLLPVVEYSLSERDKRSLATLHAELKENLYRLDLGRLEGDAEDMLKMVQDDASHHLGGTQMGRDPQYSVVDENCRVHSVDNLFIAGGSVFPTGGCASPTLTIVALAMRLAEHVKTKLSPVKKGVVNESDGVPGIIIIGAGRRVVTDVLPALESLPEKFAIKSIYAQHPKVLFGKRAQYEVLPIDTFDPSSLAGTKFVYLSVPCESVLGVIESLPPVSNLELIIDTPVASLEVLRRAERKGFSKVHIAEDTIFLPWIPLVAKVGGIKRIEAYRSLFRYHGVALLKVLVGSVRFGVRLGNVLWIKAGKTVVKMTEPRDYATGLLRFDGQAVEILREGERCVGFKFAGREGRLSGQESELVGPVFETDSVVSKMSELKRVGLYRFLDKVARNEKTWSVVDGINDAKVDRVLHRFWLYFSFV